MNLFVFNLYLLYFNFYIIFIYEILNDITNQHCHYLLIINISCQLVQCNLQHFYYLNPK